MQLIELQEWGHADSKSHAALASDFFATDTQFEKVAKAYNGKVNFQELRAGLSIRTTSFVGRVQVGQLRIAINPKLDGLKLSQLMKYAYGLRNLKLHASTTADTAAGGLQDCGGLI